MLIANKFEVVRELGRGAFGVVYQARDTYLDREVAIKTIRDENFSSPSSKESFEKRFLREARSVARLSHPHIIAVYEAGQDGEQSYIAMEFVKGTTLRDVLAARKTLPLAETLHLADALLSALDYAHGQGIIHRDIKPENIMIREDGVLKVADFGIAKALHAESTTLTKDGAVMGTPSYMPPEQVLGKPVDGRSDLFSASALLYEVLAGTKPFVSDTLPGLVHQILTVSPKPLSQHVKVPPPIEKVIMRGLSKEPDERFASCAELREALLSAGGGGSATRPVPRAAPARGEPTVPIPKSPTVHSLPTRMSARPLDRTGEVPAAKSGGGGMMVAGFAVVVVLGFGLLAAVGIVGYVMTRPDPGVAQAGVSPPAEPSPYVPATPPPSAPSSAPASPPSMAPAPMPSMAPPPSAAPMPVAPARPADPMGPGSMPGGAPAPMAPMNPSDPSMAPASGPGGAPGHGAHPGGEPAYNDTPAAAGAQAELDAWGREFRRDFESWNWSELSKYYTQDAVLINSDGTFRGRDVIDAYFETALTLMTAVAGGQKLGWSYQWVSFESDGSTAVAKTLNRMSVGGNVVDETVFLNHYRKIGGRWYVSSAIAQPGGVHTTHTDTADAGHGAKPAKEKKDKKSKGDDDAEFEFNVPIPKNIPIPRGFPRPHH